MAGVTQRGRGGGGKEERGSKANQRRLLPLTRTSIKPGGLAWCGGGCASVKPYTARSDYHRPLKGGG